MKKNEKGIRVKGLLILLLLTLVLNLTVLAEPNNKPKVEPVKNEQVKKLNNVIVKFPEINSRIEISGKTFIAYDITKLRQKIRMENTELNHLELMKRVKLRAERLEVGPEKIEAVSAETGKNGKAVLSLENNKTYMILNKEKLTEPIILDYFYDLGENLEITAKPIPVEEKAPLKPSGVNKRLFTEILDFIKMVTK